MAQSALVEGRIEDGRELLDDLIRGNLPITAAWWAKVIPEDDRVGERGEWRFFLASPLVDQQGPAVIYQKVYEALQNSQRGDPLLARISLGKIRAVGVNNPMTADVFKIIERYRGRSPISVDRCRLGSIEAEEVYIYPPNLPPWNQVRLKIAVEADEPLSPQENQAISQIVASGINPVQAGYLVWKKHEETRPRASIPAGSIVSARVVGAEDDPDPLLLVVSSDGKAGLTRKNNSEPVPSPG